VGKPSDNLTLSNNRAKAVVNYLTSKGIKAERLIAKGYGETKPVAENKTEAGRALNRRTEMKVVGL
jgi:outer membrane protein OmpA-like peptidoglycan-associated protein